MIKNDSLSFNNVTDQACFEIMTHVRNILLPYDGQVINMHLVNEIYSDLVQGISAILRVNSHYDESKLFEATVTKLKVLAWLRMNQMALNEMRTHPDMSEAEAYAKLFRMDFNIKSNSSRENDIPSYADNYSDKENFAEAVPEGLVDSVNSDVELSEQDQIFVDFYNYKPHSTERDIINTFVFNDIQSAKAFINHNGSKVSMYAEMYKKINTVVTIREVLNNE